MTFLKFAVASLANQFSHRPVSEEKVDDRPATSVELTTTRGQPSQFGYLMALEGEGNSEEPVYGPKLYQYDLYNGQCKEHFLGDGTRGAEPVYAPVPGSDAENDGWVMVWCTTRPIINRNY